MNNLVGKRQLEDDAACQRVSICGLELDAD